jgi:alcohol dehydrogenase
MRAAVLKAFGAPLCVEEAPAPTLGSGEVIVNMVAAGVVSYAREVFSGARKYILEIPVIPGAGGIGRIASLGPDATRLAVGDWVFCDCTVRSRDDAVSPDIILQCVTAGSVRALRLQRYFHDGSYAEQLRTPTENVFPLGEIDPAEAPLWCRVSSLLVPYGGLLSIDLKAGETLVVNGATGKFGGAAVEVALAMGAACVLATGRNAAGLAELARRYGPRVRPVVMTGEEDADRAKIIEQAPGPIDCVFDILPPAASQTQVRAAVLAVRPNGRVSLMGGVGMQGGAELQLPYSWIMRNNITIRGQWMYPREAAVRMISLVKSGQIDLKRFDTTTFALNDIGDAVDHAAVNASPFQATVITI